MCSGDGSTPRRFEPDAYHGHPFQPDMRFLIGGHGRIAGECNKAAVLASPVNRVPFTLS
jgi:hypothetical protein